MRKRNKGFSLIELTIVMTVAGLLMAGAVSLYDIHAKKQRIQTTRGNVDAAQLAVLEYLRENGHYPCPAPINAVMDSDTYATSADCTLADSKDPPPGIGKADGRAGKKVWIGTLPTRTMFASSNIGLDGWNQRLIYAVTKDLAVDGATVNPDTGAITITNASGKKVVDGKAHFVLLSAGPDGKGAYSNRGGKVSECLSAQGKDNDNCTMSSATFRAIDDFANIEGLNHFDDIITYSAGTSNDVVSKLLACNELFSFYSPADPKADASGCVTRTPKLQQTRVSKRFKSPPGGSANSRKVVCPSGYVVTGCIENCGGKSQDLDTGVGSNYCSIGSNDQCTGSGKSLSLKAICTRITF